MMEKPNGFTLIETIVAMFMLSITMTTNVDLRNRDNFGEDV